MLSTHFIYLILAVFLWKLPGFWPCAMDREHTWCGCGQGKQTLGQTLSACIGGDCPSGYTCVCDYCCEGCFDDCYDCALFAQYCNNTNYCELRQKCKRTCGLCVDANNTNTNTG